MQGNGNISMRISVQTGKNLTADEVWGGGQRQSIGLQRIMLQALSVVQ